MTEISVRKAFLSDVGAILHIYNQGIEDRIATLEEDMKESDYMRTWFTERGDRYAVLVCEVNEQVIGVERVLGLYY